MRLRDSPRARPPPPPPGPFSPSPPPPYYPPPRPPPPPPPPSLPHPDRLGADRLTPMMRRPDPRLHRRGARGHHECRGVANAAVAVLVDIALDLPLDRPLQGVVERGVDARRSSWTRGEQRIDEVRRQ